MSDTVEVLHGRRNCYDMQHDDASKENRAAWRCLKTGESGIDRAGITASPVAIGSDCLGFSGRIS